MADVHTSFSVLLPLPPTKVMAAMGLFQQFVREAPNGFLCFDAAPSISPSGLFLGSDDGDIDEVVEFISRCCVRFYLTGRFGLFWSSASSDMRPGGFNGGALVIDLGTGEVVDELNTSDWINSRIVVDTQPFQQAGHADGTLQVRPFTSEDSQGFELFDPANGDIAAVVHDGPDRRPGDARNAADVLAAAPVMLRFLSEALAIGREAFDEDLEVKSGDLVETFATWRQKVRRMLQIDTAVRSAVS